MRKRGWRQGRANVGCMLAVVAACGAAGCGSHTVLPIGGNSDGGSGSDAGFLYNENHWVTLPGADGGADYDAATDPGDAIASSDATVEDGASGDDGGSTVPHDAGARADASVLGGAWQLAESAAGYVVVHRERPVPVSGCIRAPAGGLMVTYEENQTDTRERTLTITWDRVAAYEAGLSPSPEGVPYSVTEAVLRTFYGTIGGTSVSSATTIGQNVSGRVIAFTSGVWYRQAVEVRRSALLYYRTPVGRVSVVASVEVLDWLWNTELALSDQNEDCDGSHLPPPRALPPAF